jgi:hypothetical protein
VPFVAKLFEFVLGVRPGERTCELTQQVVLSLQHDAPGTLRSSHESLTDAQSGGPQLGNRNGDLVFRTDPRSTSGSILYMLHEK